MSEAQNLASEVNEQCSKYVIGREDEQIWILACLLARGHMLLEGVPGVAKTLAAVAISKTLGLQFGRIQFTPDLMPADITGTNIFNMRDKVFEFIPGPVFSNLVLADEINRAPARTQAALLQAMQERQVSVDNTTHLLKGEFMVLATQNPIEFEGTYRLPEAELDRFMARIQFNYPTKEQEEQILLKTHEGKLNHSSLEEIHPIPGVEEALTQARTEMQAVTVDETIIRYIRDLIIKTRTMPEIHMGCSPRAGAALLQMTKAVAVLGGRKYVDSDLVQECAEVCLPHRWVLRAESEIRGKGPELLGNLFSSVKIS